MRFGADILCLQEIKARPEQVDDLWLSSWPYQLWNPAEKAGYSGVLVLSRVKPLSTSTGIGWPEHDREGRVCTMEFEQFYLVNCYTPNSQSELAGFPTGSSGIRRSAITWPAWRPSNRSFSAAI